MAKLTLGQKAYRVLLLLLGLRHPAVAAALVRRGFDAAELALGHQLLAQLTAGRLKVADVDAIAAPLAKLDDWENRNYPVIEAVLRRHFPDVCAVVFLNLSQTEGPELVVSVETLIERLDAQSEPVREMLAKRGVTPAVLDEARGFLHTISTIAPAGAQQIDAEADAIAEEALWAWYLEWSTIVRTDIQNRRLLRNLGFLKRPSGEVVEVPIDDEQDEEATSPTRPVEPSRPIANGNEPPPFIE
jgi:hypothetical protein